MEREHCHASLPAGDDLNRAHLHGDSMRGFLETGGEMAQGKEPGAAPLAECNP